MINTIKEIELTNKQLAFIQKLGEKSFIEIYNKIPQNPIRTEQALCVLYNLSQREGRNVKYLDYYNAVGKDFTNAGREVLPYIHPDLFHFYIVDNNGNFGGQIFLAENTWSYMASKWANTFWDTKEQAEQNVLMLKKLASVAGFDLDWIIVFANERDIRKEHINEFEHINIKVPRGMTLAHRKIYRESKKVFKQ